MVCCAKYKPFHFYFPNLDHLSVVSFTIVRLWITAACRIYIFSHLLHSVSTILLICRNGISCFGLMCSGYDLLVGNLFPFWELMCAVSLLGIDVGSIAASNAMKVMCNLSIYPFVFITLSCRICLRNWRIWPTALIHWKKLKRCVCMLGCI